MPADDRLRGLEVVRAYGARQFAAGHLLVRLEGLGSDGLARAVVTVRLGLRMGLRHGGRRRAIAGAGCSDGHRAAERSEEGQLAGDHG